jgi:hypothetical protein
VRLNILEDTAVVKSVLVMFWLKVGGMGREQKRESHPCLVMLVLEDPAIMENVKSLF